MRNPNGLGSAVKLSGKRRNPYGARVTVGFKENGQPIYRFIGFYPTRKEATAALWARYNNPESVVTVDNKLISTSSITLQRVYDEWSEEYYNSLSHSAVVMYSAAFKALDSIYERSFESLTINDYEEAFVDSGKSKVVLAKTKTVLKQMYIFAFRKGYIPESSLGLPLYISTKACDDVKQHTKHRAFTADEIDALWAHRDDDGAQIVLFMIYTGLRIREASNLKKDDVKLNERYFSIRKSKTAAGVRDVPINEKIVYIIKKWLENDDERLVPLHAKSESSRIQSRQNGFDETMERVGLSTHLQHDTRYTCATLLTEAGVDERYVKLIVGHASQDVTNKIYAAKLDIRVLIDAINKI